MRKLNTVLLVDDDEATNFINKLLFTKMNVAGELVTARNGKEALAFLHERGQESAQSPATLPQLILLDLNMPVMDGFGFLQAFENLSLPDKDSAVIAVLTTSLNPQDLEKIKAAGVSDFLNKPLTKETLQNLLEKHFK